MDRTRDWGRGERGPVALIGGPRDGARARATDRADTLLFHGEPAPGYVSAYRRTRLRTPEGLPVFSWSGTAPPPPRR